MAKHRLVPRKSEDSSLGEASGTGIRSHPPGAGNQAESGGSSDAVANNAAAKGTAVTSIGIPTKASPPSTGGPHGDYFQYVPGELILKEEAAREGPVGKPGLRYLRQMSDAEAITAGWQETPQGCGWYDPDWDYYPNEEEPKRPWYYLPEAPCVSTDEEPGEQQETTYRYVSSRDHRLVRRDQVPATWPYNSTSEEEIRAVLKRSSFVSGKILEARPKTHAAGQTPAATTPRTKERLRRT